MYVSSPSPQSYEMMSNIKICRYPGDLTITMSSGLSITIPNNQFVLPDLSVDDDGHLSSNESVREIIINSLQAENENDLPILGRQFSHQRTLWSIKMIETSLSGRLMPHTTRISKPSAHPLFVLPPCRLASVPIHCQSHYQSQRLATETCYSLSRVHRRYRHWCT